MRDGAITIGNSVEPGTRLQLFVRDRWDGNLSCGAPLPLLGLVLRYVRARACGGCLQDTCVFRCSCRHFVVVGDGSARRGDPVGSTLRDKLIAEYLDRKLPAS